MIYLIKEGEYHHQGINIVRITDGGFVICVMLGRLMLYFRRRGFCNKVKPRHFLTCNWKV